MKKLKNLFSRIFNFIIDLLYEKNCPFDLSGVSNNGVQDCIHFETCSSDLGHICNLCHNELTNGLFKRQLTNIDEVVSVAEYKGNSKKLVHKFKWSNPKLAKPIAYLINETLKKEGYETFWKEVEYLVPIPGLIEEADDWIPSELLTNNLSKLWKLKTLNNILCKTKQTNLSIQSKQARKQLVKEAYALNNNVNKEEISKLQSAQNIIIIDDTVTSGTTLEICAKLLKQINPKLKIKALTYTSVGK